MAKSRQAIAHEFSRAAREQIMTRDRGCIFCQMHYKMDKATWLSQQILSIMHYIPRSQGGLGIPENGAVGCQYHHHMLDNGNTGSRAEMLVMFRNYLQIHYVDWNEDKLIYRKWG